MSNGIKDIFGNLKSESFSDLKKKIQAASGQGVSGPSKIMPSASMDSLGLKTESPDYIRAEVENKKRVVPVADFSTPENFARYGSAQEYYKTSVERIYKTYPYDGSKKEKLQWSLSSSYLDNYIFENEYPRTNGYVNFYPDLGGADISFVNNAGKGNEPYIKSKNPQYISVKGGPNQASLPIYEQDLNKTTDYKKPEHKANFYDTSNSRTKNITIDGTSGNTVEFWFKINEDLYRTKAFFDAWNGDGTSLTQHRSASYGRFMIESRFEISAPPGLVDNSLFHLTYMSGAAGAERVALMDISVVGFPVNNLWNHYAFTVKNSDNQINIRSYLNGKLIDNVLTGTAVSEVTGSSAGGIDANIGAYRTFPTDWVKYSGGGHTGNDFEGGGNVTGSFDEFRFWKSARTDEQVGINWFTQVGAGTNTDVANTKLGFYFKFNEGITGVSGQDQTVLDYSGRVSNGTFQNYAAETINGGISYGPSRETGSAIVESSAAEKEFKDPILYPLHPSVSSYKASAMSRGEEWDYRNPSLLFNTLPGWIQDEDSKNGNTSRVLTQILGSYFDTLHMQIEEMPKIKTHRYLSSSIDSGPKPFPYASKLLTNAGFVAPEIFANTDVIAALTHRDNNREYEKKLYDVKNYIYQNIYNNLAYINKSKGTQKSIRNLIRCFGIGEEIYKINMYADNAEYTLNNNFVDKTIRKTYADFNDVSRNNATVFSFKEDGSSGTDNFGYLTGSNNTSTGFDRGLAMTVEAEVILPRKPPVNTPNFENKYYPKATSSLFGMHSAKSDLDYNSQLAWDINDYANFQVYATIDDSRIDGLSSKNVKFVLKSYNSVLPELTSSLYIDQYQDTKWNFAVRVKPKGYPNVGNTITGAAGKTYDVEFEGLSTISDVVINSFKATGSISNGAGANFITQKKRLYVGAHRTNFTGTVREQSDVLVSSCRYWADDITSDELKFHAIDPSSYGVADPNRNAYLYVTKFNPSMEVPRIKTLCLNWEFDTVTGSDGSGEFIVKDSSYTINQNKNYQNWDSSIDLANLLEGDNTAKGAFFQSNSTASVSREYLQAYNQQLPENINDSNMITVATTDDLTFTKNTLPVKFSFSLEKSMYQTISEEMIKFFFASKEASAMENLIGDPVNRYRINYKSMEKMRNIFFNTVGNTPDLEKYLDYYKWLDSSITKMVAELIPASAKLNGATNVVEGHMLDRGGKYQTKFPTLEIKKGIIEDAARGINELKYNWRFGHAPLAPSIHGVQATASITTTTGGPLNNETFNLTDAAGLSVGFVFKTASTLVDGTKDGSRVIIGVQGAAGSAAAVGERIRDAINASDAAITAVETASGVVGLTQNGVGFSGNTPIDMSGVTTVTANSFVGGIPVGAHADKNQDNNCFWWNKRALRDDAGLSSGDANIDADKKLIHSASLQVLNRKLDTTIDTQIDRLALRADLNKKQVIFAETAPGSNEKISFSTSTFSKPVECSDTSKINPQFKFKPQFRVTGSVYQGQMVSPIVFYSASATDLQHDKDTNPTGYYKTAQHLLDYYSETKDIPMQGPFTEQHVGGYQYRHTGLNIGLATTRQEGWYTETSVIGGETYFIFYNPRLVTGYPRAGYSRDHIAKSYVNIKNIKNITSSNNPGTGTTNELGSSIALGNYSHDYEIAQIPGRPINNKYFIENLGIGTGSVESDYIGGLFDRTIPDRGKNKYVFVNKFSAPGGPDTMGAGYLDVESESFSVYNALPFRNLAVRTPLNSFLLKRHMSFGGYDYQYPIDSTTPVPSFHKTPSNGAKRLKINIPAQAVSHDGLGLNLVTGTTFDNAFVQHMIPQSDMQYSWITASALIAPFGYAQPNPANASMASTDITFVSASEIGSFDSSANRFFGIDVNSPNLNGSTRFGYVPSAFVPLNINFYSIFNTSSNTITSDANTASFLDGDPGIAGTDPSLTNNEAGIYGTAGVLNATLLRANGAGGFSSWKQVRQADHPLVKDMRKYNRLSILKSTASLYTDIYTGADLFHSQKTLHSYTEPPVTSKYKPLRHQLQVYNHQDKLGTGEAGDQFVVKSSYGNNLAYFTMTNTLGVNLLFDGIASVGTGTPHFGGTFDPTHPTHVKQVYDDLKRIYLTNENEGIIPGSNPIKRAPLVTYREVVYPKESNTFLARTRMRENYSEASGSDDFNRPLGKARTFWRVKQADRLRSIGSADNSMDIPIDSGSFKHTTYEGVMDLSCWPLDANYPMVQIAPTGAGGAMGGTQTLRHGEGSLRLPTTTELRSLNGELSYNNWVYNLYNVPMRGDGASSTTTLTGTASPTASLSYEYPNIILSGSDPNNNNQDYAIAHLNLIPKWTANITSSRDPWFDSYDDYSNDIRRMGKDYSVLPEFRISDHMDLYLKEGFNKVNEKFLDLIGASLENTSSATSVAQSLVNSTNSEFFRLYAHSDFLKHFEVIRKEHVNYGPSSENEVYFPSKIQIKCRGIKKLLPYQGFYPALRTVQLGQMFSQSYGPYLTGNYDAFGTDYNIEQQTLSSLIQPFFAPGIMFNTIKSGIAVDWPVLTASVESATPTETSYGTKSIFGYRAGGLFNFEPNWRLPFEALYAPNKHLPSLNENNNETLGDRPDATIYHLWPHYSNADVLSNQGSSHAKRFSPKGAEEFRPWYSLASYNRPTPNFAWKGEYDNRYNLAMNNFLAETVEFFLEEKELTKFASKPQKDFLPMMSGTTYYMDVVLRKTRDFKMYEGPDQLFLVATNNTGSAATIYTGSVGARGMHYGPYFVSNGDMPVQTNFKQEMILQQIGDPGPAPYTPPYFYGSSVARIAFRPHALYPMEEGEARVFTLSEIFSSAELETSYFNINEFSNGIFEFKKVKDPITGQQSTQAESFASGTAAYRNQMPIRSSVKLFERFADVDVSYNPIVNTDGKVEYVLNEVKKPENEDTGNDRWIIETKFECPTLNFYNSSFNPEIPAASRPDITGDERVATNGMWRTYGTIPDINKGVFIEVKDSFPQLSNATKTEAAGGTRSGTRTVTNPITGLSEGRGPSAREIKDEERDLLIQTTGSLVEICGFDVTTKRVGQLATTKTISEAIVAIPVNSNGSMCKIKDQSFDKQVSNLANHGVAVKAGDFPGVTKDIQETSISDMIQKMKKYVIPPHLDFLNNPEAREKNGAFVMYIFEFEHQLSKQDLSLIWQNMMPDISVTAKKSESSIQHSVLTGDLDFFGVDPKFFKEGNSSLIPETRIFSPEMKWVVFKVKRRAKNNFEGISVTKSGEKLGFSALNPQKSFTLPAGFENQEAYGYNWPYDFFSLVELAKIETGVKFKPKKLSPPGEKTIDQTEIEVEIDEAITTEVNETVGQGTAEVDVIELTQEDLINPGP